MRTAGETFGSGINEASHPWEPAADLKKLLKFGLNRGRSQQDVLPQVRGTRLYYEGGKRVVRRS